MDNDFYQYWQQQFVLPFSLNDQDLPSMAIYELTLRLSRLRMDQHDYGSQEYRNMVSHFSTALALAHLMQKENKRAAEYLVDIDTRSPAFSAITKFIKGSPGISEVKKVNKEMMIIIDQIGVSLANS